MNKEQAKATIENESLLRQEAKNSIIKKELPVSDMKYGEDTVRKLNEPRAEEILVNQSPKDELQSELYVESVYQVKRYEKVKGPNVDKTEGPFDVPVNSKDSVKYETKEGKDKLTRTKFTNKKPGKFLEEGEERKNRRSQANSKYEVIDRAKEDKASDKLFKVSEDRLSDVISKKKKTNTKLTDEELRLKAYFADKLENRTDTGNNPCVESDDAIVFKTFKKNRQKKLTDRNHIRSQSMTLSATKYHVRNSVDEYQNCNEKDIQDESLNSIRNAARFSTGKANSIVTGKRRSREDRGSRIRANRFTPNAIRKNRKSIISSKEDLVLQDKRTLLRYIAAKKKDEVAFDDIKSSLARKIVSKIKQITSRNKIGVIIAAVCLAFILSAVASVGILFEGISEATGVYLSGLSLSTDFDMTDCENYFTKKEADLQDVLDNLEEYYPGFDRYVIDFDDEIGHDPYKLMAYLSAVYEGYDLKMIQGVLNELFDDMYVIETEEEIITEDDEEISVFTIKITKSKWDDLMASRITDDKSDLYDSYEDSGGGHQAFHNPFSIKWSGKVTSEFGWRIHPISGKEKFHRGVDIGMPSGTPVMSCSEGVVVTSTCTDVEGNYVVVEDEAGYRCCYMHLSQRNVSVGDIVTYDTLIGEVGSTGYSTGPHLHLQIMDKNGECLNPRFMVQGGN